MDIRHRTRQTLRALVPSEVRRLLERRALRGRHGLVGLGPSFDYEIDRNTTFGTSCRLGGPVYIAGSTIGDYTYIELGCRISAADVGRFCSIAPYTLVGLAEHPARDFVSTHPLFYRHLPHIGYDLVDQDQHQELTRTRIGHDVWIGAGACVRSGITVGHGAIIGAGAVVTHDVPPYAVFGGVPARLIRYRFDVDTVRFLLELRWWDRDHDWLREHADALRDVRQLKRRLGGNAATDGAGSESRVSGAQR